MTTDAVRRLLVALDNAGPCEGALRTFARLLAPTPLELTGLFVEDEDLLRAAALPGLREISLSGQASNLDPERIARELAGAAAAARRTFETVAGHLAREHGHLRHRFEVARGRTGEEFRRAAAGQDVVVVSRAYRATGLRPRLGRSFLALARQPGSVLFINEPWDSGSSLVVLDGDPDTLAYAARIAELERLRLVVARLVVARLEGGQPPQAEAAPLPGGASVRMLSDMEEETLAGLCLSEDARLLVLPPPADVDWAELLVSLVDKLPCSLLKLALQPGP